ncbi:MAG TPA: pitrilysin family protein [Gemmatimonadaceae bacterium]|nr:pitrilysin family protein [Gemmatimonadaceae bacterium]
MRRDLMVGLASFVLAAPALAQQPEREKPPAPGPLRPFTVPAIRETRLPNGIRVAVAERRSLPIVHARIIVNAGSVHEPADKSGLASLTGTLLIEGGAGGMASAELARRIEVLAAQIGSSASYSLGSVNVTSLSNVFADALALAATAVRAPSFEEREFGRVRSQALSGYEQAMSSAEAVADRTFTRAMYRAEAPYSRNPAGTATTLNAITRADVVNWHARMYAPANTTILFVGDIAFNDAVALVTRLFGDWNVSAPAVTLPANPLHSTTTSRVILVDRPGSVQSAIYVGVPGIATTDQDFFKMTVLHRLLGGGFTSRINTNLRERRGFTYGANTTLATLQNAGTFYASSSVRTSATDSALTEVMNEFRRIVDEPVPAAEFQAGVNNLVASFPASVQSVQELANRLQTLLIYGMPLNYYNTYRERLAAVTPAELNTIAKQRLVPNAVTMVVVGDLAQIEAPIRSRNFGTVEVWNREGTKIR